MQGFRLLDGEYVPIEPRQGRLRSEVLGMELEREGNALRLNDSATGRRIPTVHEIAERAQARLAFEEAERLRAQVEVLTLELQVARAEAEIANLRRELEASRRRPEGSGPD